MQFAEQRAQLAIDVGDRPGQLGRVIEHPGFQLLRALTEAQIVGPDGMILIPYVGRLLVVGLTESELDNLVTQQLQEAFAQPFTIYSRFSSGPGPR